MPSSFKVNDDEDDAINDHKANFLLLTAPAFQVCVSYSISEMNYVYMFLAN